MSKKTKKHSKFKNAGILFELLTRQITSDILANRDESFTKDLVFRYFNENNELGKEAQLYNIIVNQAFKNTKSADRILEVILTTRKKLNEKELKRQKYSLIREIKQKYDIDEFLKNKIPNYKLYASIYKVFENEINEEISFSVPEIVGAKEYIVENLTKKSGNSDKVMDIYTKQSIDVQMLAYEFLIENFNKKYDGLSSKQKTLLKQYINSSTPEFTTYFISEINNILDDSGILLSTLNTVDDDVIKIKLNETVNQLKNFNYTVAQEVKENHINALMYTYELVEELQHIKDHGRIEDK